MKPLAARLRSTYSTTLVIIALLSPVMVGANSPGRGTVPPIRATGSTALPAQQSVQQAAASQEKQYSSEEHEFLRARLLELIDAVKDFSDSIVPENLQSAQTLELARQQFKQMTSKDLNTLRQSLDPSKMNDSLPQALAVLADFKPGLKAYHSRKRKKSGSNPGPEEGPPRCLIIEDSNSLLTT